jgi:alkanesulfonate monooxygenase SsuD/methylene tetrahydromethanopterin reductase-like flavin-dependent oxidoreductase (luciferase family)
MEFGTLIFTKPERAITDPKLAEQFGYSHAWIPDSHMIWGDVWACMALAAVNTNKIKLGTGVAIATNRIPPVTAEAIGTINELAPGRVILGFGTGHTGRRVMGLPPVKHAVFREEVRVIHDLLQNGEATYNTEGMSKKIQFLHRDRRFINLDGPIPFYVAANGPKTLALAGEFGDGCVTTGVTNPDRVESVLKHIRAGADRAKRKLPAKFPIVSLTHVCVVQPGEDLDSPRIKTMCGPWVMANLHAFAAGYARAESLPAPVRPVFQAYMDYVSKMKTPRDERYLELHRGHCCYVEPAEWKFVTPESIECCTIVGPREKVIEQIRGLEKAGLAQIFLNPPMDGFADCIEEIAREVIQRV